jgi:excinuclease ABC subunit C
VLALAKRLEELFRPGQSEPIVLPRTSESLRLLQRIRNEAHRFAVEYHRLLRTRHTLRTELTAIPGIGERTAERLLRHFGSVERLRTASLEELLQHLPRSRAHALYAYFHPEESGTQSG